MTFSRSVLFRFFLFRIVNDGVGVHAVEAAGPSGGGAGRPFPRGGSLGPLAAARAVYA